MANTKVPRRVLFGVLAAGTVLLAASGVYACTNFKGTMTVAGGGGSTKVVGRGDGMNYCRGYPKDDAPAPGGGAHGSSGSTITVSVSPSTGCNTLRLHAGTYNANFANGAAYTYTVKSTTEKRKYSPILIDCMTLGRGVSPLTPSTMDVPTSGSASGTFTLPAGLAPSGPTDAGAVCLVDQQQAVGHQVPIIIL